MSEKIDYKHEIIGFIIALIIIFLVFLDIKYKTNIFFDQREPSTLTQD